MKTVYAPNTSADLVDQVQALAQANPGVVMLLALFATIAFASWAVKNL